MMAVPPKTQLLLILLYVVTFASYSHFQTSKVNFDHEGDELELEYLLCIYVDIFRSILHKITAHLT